MAKKSSKQKKMSQADFEAQRKAMFDSYGGIKKKQFKELSPRLEHGRGTTEFKSLYGQGKAECGRTNMMEPMILQKESPEVQAAILEKASRLLPLYNKGGVMYATDLEMSPKLQREHTSRK